MSVDEPNRPVARSRRLGVVLEVRYRNASQFLVSYCTNLSRGGLFVTAAPPLPIGTKVTLELAVPGRSVPAAIGAEVRWVRHDGDGGGPAGMGLRFADIDEVLGEHIDRLVTHTAPLRIDIIGRGDHASRHLDSLLRSLLACETRVLELRPEVEDVVARPDLLLVDVDADPDAAVAVISAISARSDAPPVLALCSARASELRQRVRALATVVPTPVDSNELRTQVLETLCRVEGIRVDPVDPA